MKTIDRPDVTNLELHLRVERKELLCRIQEHLHRSDDPQQISVANYMTEADDWTSVDLLADTDIAIIGHELSRLRDIEAALERISNGSYGTCTDCHDEIDSKRLNAQPAARLCLACKETFEKRRGIVTRRTI